MSQSQNNWRNKEGRERERDGERDEPREVISNTVGRREQEGPGAPSMTVTATGIEATGTSSSMSKAVNFTSDSAPVLEDPNGNMTKKEELNVASSSSVGKKESPSDTTLQQDLRCPICMDFFIEPTITDCAHVFCHFCINYWFVNRGRSICPQCRNAVERVVPSQNLNAKVEKYVLTHLSKDALEERERVKEIRRRDLNFTIDEVALLEESTVSPYSSSSGDIDDLFWAFTLQQAVPESGVGVRGEFTATASVWPSATGTNNPSAMSSPSFLNSLLSTTNSVDSSQLPSRMDSSTNMHLPGNDIQGQSNREGGENLEDGSNREGHLQEMGSTLNQFEYRLDRAQRAYGVLLTAQREMNHQLAHLHSISYRLDRYDRQGVAATAAHHSRSRNSSTPQSFIQHPLPIPIPDLSVFTSNISQSVNPSLNNSFFEHLTNVGSSPRDHEEQDDVQEGQTSSSESNNSNPRLNGHASARRNSITTPTRIGVGVAGNGWNDPVSANNYHYLDPNAMWYWLSSPYYHHAGNSRFYPPTHSDLTTHNHHHHHQNRQLTMHSGSGQSHGPGCPLHDLNLRGQAHSGNSYGRHSQRHGHLSSNYHFHPIPEAVSSTSIQDETGTRIGEERETCCSSNGNSNSSNVTSSDCREGTDIINSNLLQEFPRTTTRTRSSRHNRRRRCCERPYQSNQSRSHNSNSLSLSSHQLDPRSTEFDEEFLEEITSHLADSELAEAIERSLVLDIFDSRDTSTSPGQSSSPNLIMDEDGLADLTSRTDIYFQHYSHRECEGSRQHRSQQQNQHQSHHDHSHQGGHPHSHQHPHHNSSRQRPLH